MATFSLEPGFFYVIRFGNGTQLIKVHGLTKTGKRAIITRCESWKTDPRWQRTSSTISVNDKRIQSNQGTLCPLAVGPFADEVVFAEIEVEKINKKQRKLAAQKIADANNERLADWVAPPCVDRFNTTSPIRCPQGVHYQPSIQNHIDPSSHRWSCENSKELRKLALDWDERQAIIDEHVEPFEALRRRILGAS